MDDQNIIQIREGMDVVGADGEKLGDVDHQEGDVIVVKKGFFFPKEYYIPSNAIASADADRVYLTVSKDSVLDQGWDAAPYDRVGSADATYADGTHVADPTLVDDPLLATDQAGTRDLDDSDIPATTARQRTTADVDTGTDSVRVPLSEEELTATKRPVERGAVRVSKDVVEEDRSLDVPVTEEEVHVSRRTVDRDIAPGETAFEEGTIEVPVRGEEVDVEKRARVTGEVEISKQATEKTQRVSGTVRREEAHVEDGTQTIDEDDDLNTSDRNRDRNRPLT